MHLRSDKGGWYSPQRPTSRPDLDNYVKSALDAINTIVIGDNAQIVELTARKQFT